MSTQDKITQWLSASLALLHEEGISLKNVQVQVTASKGRTRGDYTSNIALVAAGQTDLTAHRLAQKIVAYLPTDEILEKVEVAGPGFINFYIKTNLSSTIIREIIEQGENFANGSMRSLRKRILIEYVSANPTGPLHVGHGRGAAYGESIATFFTTAGCTVEREYYVNDVGRQMDILALSVWLRYLELGNQTEGEIFFPEDCYQGDYIYDIAAAVRNRYGGEFDHPLMEVFSNVAITGRDDEGTNQDHSQAQLDVLINNSRFLLGANYAIVQEMAQQAILRDIRRDLEKFGVHHTHWFSEKTLVGSGQVVTVVNLLEDKGVLYRKDGALWFRSTDFGDDKDRVIRRENGQFTYFASDIAYHADKYARDYDLMINIWGADHHSYTTRLIAALRALDLDVDKLTIFLVQFATLYRGSKKIPMSTRAGQFVTLRELCTEVGKDAARFFYIMRKPNQHMKFDLELAKSENVDNPVYYVQYAHARIHSVFKQLEEKKITFNSADAKFEYLAEDEEIGLVRQMAIYEKTLSNATEKIDPQLLLNFLRGLATKFHAYYNRHVFLVEDEALRNARLVLLLALRILFANGLHLIGVSAPKKM